MLYIPIILILISAIVFLGIGFKICSKDKRIRHATSSTTGIVVRYSKLDTDAPVVEYNVDGISYQVSLKYSSVTKISTSFKSGKDQSINLLAPKLTVRNKSLCFLMENEFPLGSNLKVFYVPENPNLSYVERLAKNCMSLIFLSGRLICLFVCFLLAFFYFDFYQRNVFLCVSVVIFIITCFLIYNPL